MLIYNDNKKGGIRNENMADYRMFQRTWKRNRNGRPEARGKGCGNCQGREETSGIYKKYPKQVLTLKLDLQDNKSMEQAVWDTYECFGNIDVLVNNAGHGYRAAVEESEPEKIRELFETNFFAPAELIQMVLPFMRSKKRFYRECNIHRSRKRSSWQWILFSCQRCHGTADGSIGKRNSTPWNPDHAGRAGRLSDPFLR